MGGSLSGFRRVKLMMEKSPVGRLSLMSRSWFDSKRHPPTDVEVE